jgi:hypothetical protein
MAYKNFAKATLSAGINSSDTSVSFTTGHGARLDTGVFLATIYQSTDYGDAADAYHAGHAEIVSVSAGSGDTRTITRAQSGTSAVNLNTGGKTYVLFGIFDQDVLNYLGTYLNPDNSTRRKITVSGTGSDENVGFDTYP